MEDELPETWFPIPASQAAELEAELRRELALSHQLTGVDVVAIARRVRRDDVLFRSRDVNGPVFCVHLTWRVEPDPSWPMTVTYKNMNDFRKRWPHEEFEGA